EAADVNEFLRRVSGADFTAKDFRTWAGTVLAAHALCARAPFRSRAEARRKAAAAIKEVAFRLGNTAAVCRSSYVHPPILDAYVDGALPARLEGPLDAADASALSSAERAVLTFLRATERPAGVSPRSSRSPARRTRWSARRRRGRSEGAPPPG